MISDNWLVRRPWLRRLVAAVAAWWSLIAAALGPDQGSWSESLDGDNYIYLLLWFPLAHLWNTILPRLRLRLGVAATIWGVLIGVIAVVSATLTGYWDFSGILSTPTQLSKAFVRFIGFGLLAFLAAALVMRFLARYWRQVKSHRLTITAGPTTVSFPARFFFIAWATVALARLPFFLLYFPGIVVSDPAWQVYQAFGLHPFDAANPLLHTFLIKLLMVPGNAIGGIDFGIACYSVFQILVTSAAFAYSLAKLRQWGARRLVLGLVGAVICLFPNFGIYSVTVYKDVLFATAGLVLTVCLTDALRTGRKYFRAASHWVALILASIGVAFFSRTGIYVFLLGMAVFLILVKSLRRSLIILTVSVVLAYGTVEGPLMSSLHVMKNTPANAMALPVKQVAAVVKFDRKHLSKADQRFLKEVFAVDSLATVAKNYYPGSADAVWEPAIFGGYLDAHVGEFMKLWLRYGMRYPGIYTASFLQGTAGFWMPEYVQWTAETRMVGKGPDERIRFVQKPVLPQLREKLDSINIYNLRTIPVVGMAQSGGAMFSLYVLLVLALAAGRRWRLCLIFVFEAVIWLTCMASPSAGQFRYIFPLWVALPFLAVVVLEVAPVEGLKAFDYHGRIRARPKHRGTGRRLRRVRSES